MKKMLSILMMLLIFGINSLSAAGLDTGLENWYWINSSDTKSCYVDTQSMNFYKLGSRMPFPIEIFDPQVAEATYVHNAAQRGESMEVINYVVTISRPQWQAKAIESEKEKRAQALECSLIRCTVKQEFPSEKKIILSSRVYDLFKHKVAIEWEKSYINLKLINEYHSDFLIWNDFSDEDNMKIFQVCQGYHDSFPAFQN